MSRKAFLDLISLSAVFWLTWYFKALFPLGFQGASVVIATALAGLFIIRLRGLSFEEIGFVPRVLNRELAKEVMQVAFMIFAVQFLGILIVGFLLGAPDQGSAVTNQPTTIAGFLLDIFFMTWLVTGLGEELIFRGIVLNRLRVLFNDEGSNVYLISAIQAVWFGAGHQSHGFSGVLITGFIGFVLGTYLLKSPKSGLWPLILAHALIDTVVLTISFVGR